MKLFLTAVFCCIAALVNAQDVNCYIALPDDFDNWNTYCRWDWHRPWCCTGLCIRQTSSGQEKCSDPIPATPESYRWCQVDFDPIVPRGTIAIYQGKCNLLTICRCFIPVVPTMVVPLSVNKCVFNPDEICMP